MLLIYHHFCLSFFKIEMLWTTVTVRDKEQADDVRLASYTSFIDCYTNSTTDLLPTCVIRYAPHHLFCWQNALFIVRHIEGLSKVSFPGFGVIRIACCAVDATGDLGVFLKEPVRTQKEERWRENAKRADAVYVSSHNHATHPSHPPTHFFRTSLFLLHPLPNLDICHLSSPRFGLPPSAE